MAKLNAGRATWILCSKLNNVLLMLHPRVRRYASSLRSCAAAVAGCSRQ